MKVLIDTDILLDVALGRTEFFDDSAAVLIWAESHPGQASVAWHSFSNIAYLLKSDDGFTGAMCRKRIQAEN